MMDLWQLPDAWHHGGKTYPHRTDYRDMLKLMGMLSDGSRPIHYRWLLALAWFYEDPIPRQAEQEAMAYLSRFLTCGQPGNGGPKLLDWQVDAPQIIADINAVAGKEVRAQPHLHWWTFLSYFHGIGDGQLSLLVRIRQKLSRSQKLEPGEQEYYRAHKDQIRLRPPESPADTAHRKTLEALLS